MDHREKYAAGRRVTVAGALVNLILAGIKAGAGMWSGSSALVSDAVHSLSDLVSDGVVLAGLYMGGQPPDDNHPYGHGKFEAAASLVLAILLFGAGLAIMLESMRDLLDYRRGEAIHLVGQAAFWVALLGVGVKELLYRWTVRWGARLGSSVMIANAWHHRSDAFSSLAVAVGVGAASFLGAGAQVADPITALVVSFFIFHQSWLIGRDALGQLLDSSLAVGDIEYIRKTVSGVSGLMCPHSIRTRRVGTVVAMELHVVVDSEITVKRAHELVSTLEDRLKDHFGEHSIITIHVDPCSEVECSDCSSS